LRGRRRRAHLLEEIMKLYYHPVSTTCRPIMLFAADNGIDLDYQLVDLFKGEHVEEPYSTLNPCRQVPMLEDGDFRLTESSAILKYLAEKASSAAYPADLKQRARINERMDFLNTGLYRELGYGVIYPQLLPHLKRPDEKVHAANIEWGREKADGWLKILDEALIGSNPYLCGKDVTIADYLGVGMLTVGEVIKIDYAKYPNVKRWIDTFKSRPNWSKVNEPFYEHFVAPFSDKEFVRL
jgi:glutathione S-transferase